MAGFLSRLLGQSGVPECAWVEAPALQQRLAAGAALLLIDVRQPEEFSAPPGHLPGALNVPAGDIAGMAGELASRRCPIVVVCKTDRRSARAAAELAAAGLRDVAVLRGGTDAWHQLGFGLE